MPPFGRKPTPPLPEPTPPLEPAAQERLAALLAEQAELQVAIANHCEERSRLLRESENESGVLGAIRALAAQTEQASLRLEQISLQLPDIEAAVEREHRAAWEAAWEERRPDLAAAETELADAIRGFQVAMARANALHNVAMARGFGDKLREFVRPPHGSVSTIGRCGNTSKPLTVASKQCRQQHRPSCSRWRRPWWRKSASCRARCPTTWSSRFRQSRRCAKCGCCTRCVRATSASVMHGSGQARKWRCRREQLSPSLTAASVYTPMLGRQKSHRGEAQTVDHTDWINATGNAYAGRGARPLNPKLLPGLVAKAAPAKAKPKRSNAYRRLVVALAESSLSASRTLAASYQRKQRDSRADTVVPPLWRQAIDPAARLRALAILHRWHGPR